MPEKEKPPARLVDNYSKDSNYDEFATSGYYTFYVNITYLSDSATLEENFAVSHMNYYGITNVKTYIDQNLRTNRSLDFSDFPLFKNNKGTLDVTNSEELVYALERGYLPHFTVSNSSAEHLYNKMLATLKNIITTDMDDNMKMLAIYEYVNSLPRNQYVEYFRSLLATTQKTIKGIDAKSGTNTFNYVDDHKYVTEYLEAWDSDFGIGQGCMSKLLVCLLALEGITSFRDYKYGVSVSNDEKAFTYYIPFVTIKYENDYYILTPQDDKYIDCSSLYSEMLYSGFMRSTSMFAMIDFSNLNYFDYNGIVFGYKQELFVADNNINDANFNFNNKVNYSFGTKQYGSNTYDYIIETKEEVTHLFNNIKASGFKGLGYVTIQMAQGLKNFKDWYEMLCQGIEASDVDFVESFGYTNIKEAGDYRDKNYIDKYVSLIDSYDYRYNGYIISPYYDYIIYCDNNSESHVNTIARTVVITFNIK